MTKIGTYPVTLSASLTSYPAVTAVTKTFTATLLDPCLTTTLTLPTAMSNFSLAYGNGPYSQTFMPATDSKATAAGVSSLCGPRVYSIVEATPAAFMTITSPTAGQEYTSAWTLSALTSSCADRGSWTVTLRASL